MVCSTDTSWEYLSGPVINSEIYNGEIFDTALDDPTWSTAYPLSKGLGNAEKLPFPVAQLIAPEVAPVRRIMEIEPQKIILTPGGKTVLDFGQNLVGWLRINKDIFGPGELVIRHAEVMEHGELGTRPLRTAKAEARIHLSDRGTKGYEPRFTFYGFRWASWYLVSLIVPAILMASIDTQKLLAISRSRFRTLPRSWCHPTCAGREHLSVRIPPSISSTKIQFGRCVEILSRCLQIALSETNGLAGLVISRCFLRLRTTSSTHARFSGMVERPRS